MSQHWRAFDAAWFARHQAALIWLLSFPLTRRWFRWVLRICPGDVGHDREIVELLPHCYTVTGEQIGTLTTDFRTHPKYAKRLYYAFRPVWWAMHWWDELVADLFVPRWSFGFDTLVSRPDHFPGSTISAVVEYTGAAEPWSAVLAEVGNAVSNGSNFAPLMQITAGSSAAQFSLLARVITTFDTSPLTSGASISAATLSYFGFTAKDDLSAAPDVNVYASSPASNGTLVGTDFSTFGSVAFSTAISYASYFTNAYNDFALNSSGIAAISKTGISTFGARNANYDAAAATPPWVIFAITFMNAWMADNTGISRDPTLVVSYTFAAAVADMPPVMVPYPNSMLLL
jgi:hypothetical protein